MMSEKYDGWTVKSFWTFGEPWIIPGFYHRLKSQVIKQFEESWGKGEWRKERRKGYFKLVKIKLIEVK